MEQQKDRKRRRNRGSKPGGRKLHTQQRREWPKIVQGQKEVTQKWTQGGGEMRTSKSHSRHKTGTCQTST